MKTVRIGVLGMGIAACLAIVALGSLLTGTAAERKGEGRSTVSEMPKVDEEIPSYTKVPGVAGSLSSVGSDTLNNLMALWAEGFQKHYPNVKIQVEGKGSSTAPPALAEGTAQLGPMSRKMKNDEIEKIEKKYGFTPTPISVAIDCIAVFVHKDNPVKGLTFVQLDGIFSKTRKRGGPDIQTWGEVGVEGELANKPISLYGRNSASGTYGYFKEEVLHKGDFKDTVKEQPGSAGVVSSVANDIAGIGYSGIGYKTADVRAIPLAKEDPNKFVEPLFENALNGTYPLGRALYIYILKEPNKPLPPLVAEFMKFILSKEGQEIVVKDGFGPLTKEMVDEQLKKLE